MDTADALYVEPDAGPDAAVDTHQNDTSLFDGIPGNCIERIQSNGYAFGAAPACSACNDNGTPLGDKCTGMIDCLATAWPCTASDSCWWTCLNSVQASGVVSDCAAALTNAACQ